MKRTLKRRIAQTPTISLIKSLYPGHSYTDSEDNDGDGDGEDQHHDIWDDPYKDIDPEEILAPITHASDVIELAPIARIYNTSPLPTLAQRALVALAIENEHKIRLTKLLSVLLGDDTVLFPPNIPAPSPSPTPSLNGGAEDDVVLADVEDEVVDGDKTIEDIESGIILKAEERVDSDTAPIEGDVEDDEDDEDESEEHQPRRPTTRLQTAVAEASTTTTSTQMLITPQSEVDRVLELTPKQSADARRTVQAALERSQEFVRCLVRVRNAIVRADTMRQKVMGWCEDAIAERDEEDDDEEDDEEEE